MARRDGPGFRFALCVVADLMGLCVFPAVPASASCVGGGIDVDLVATGTVEDIKSSRTSSRIEVLVHRVLLGDRSMSGQTLSLRSDSGTGAVSSVDVSFREGALYMLYLQRTGGEWTTNICLGTGEISGEEASGVSPIMPETGGPGLSVLLALAGVLVIGTGVVVVRRGAGIRAWKE